MTERPMNKTIISTRHIDSLLESFRGLDLHDPAGWPLIPRVFLISTLFVLASISGWWFLWQEQLENLENKEKQEIALKTEFIDKKKQSVNLDLHIQQLKEIDRSFGALLKQLPHKSEVEALLVEINQAGMGRGLQFELFKPEQEQI